MIVRNDERNIRRTTGIAVLQKLYTTIDVGCDEELMLRKLLRYDLAGLLLLTCFLLPCFLAYRSGVI
jgi:hypothetical protein